MHTSSIDFNQLHDMEVEHCQVIICNRLAALENSYSDVDTMKFSRADSRIKM
jgi:hypothetical protein